MKIFKIIFGVLAGLFALAYLPKLLLSGEHPSVKLGSFATLCIIAAIAYALLASVFRKKTEEKE